jgi:hypothetical protein
MPAEDANPSPDQALHSRRELLGFGGALLLPAQLEKLVALGENGSGPAEHVQQSIAMRVVSNVAALRALAAPAVPGPVLVLGYRRPTDGGGGTYYWDADSSIGDNGGTYIVPDSRPASGRWKLLHTGIVGAAQFGASPAVSPSTNVEALHNAWRFIDQEGGEIVLEPRAVYQLDAPLDFRVDGTARNYARSIRGMGATLDFSGPPAGATSVDRWGNAVLVRVGATSEAKAPETTWHNISGLIIKGPERDAQVANRRAGHLRDAVPATTTTGLVVEAGLNLNLRDVQVTNCHTGLRFRDSWSGAYENLSAQKCVLGHHFDEGCTYLNVRKSEAVHCTFAYLFKPLTRGASLVNIVLDSPRAEACTLGFHIDQGDAGADVWHVRINDPYMENVFGDGFRVGIAFDSAPARWNARGAARAGKMMSFMVDGGTFSGAGSNAAGTGTTDSYGPARKAFVFAPSANVASGRIFFPCQIADILNPPQRISFQSSVRAEDALTAHCDFVYPGFGIGRFTGDARNALPFRSGNIERVTRLAPGLFDVHFFTPYATREACICIATATKTGHVASVDEANSAPAKARIEVRTTSGALADAGFQVVVQGQLATL